MRAGETLPSVVASYLTSLEFARRGMVVPQSGEIVVAQAQGFIVYTEVEDAAVGKHVRSDNYERDVTALFHARLAEGMNVIDIGANIGYFTLLAAKLIGPRGRVLAVEPNPRNVRLLEASRRANGFANVTILQAAAGREIGILGLNVSFSNGTTAGLPEDLPQMLAAETVPCLPLDSVLDRDTMVDFIKVDVEGAEFNALLGAEGIIRRCRPVIVSEFSPSMMPGISQISGEAYLRWLIGLGYTLAVVEPDGSLTRTGQDVGAVMRIYEARMADHIDIVAEAT